MGGGEGVSWPGQEVNMCGTTLVRSREPGAFLGV